MSARAALDLTSKNPSRYALCKEEAHILSVLNLTEETSSTNSRDSSRGKTRSCADATTVSTASSDVSTMNNAVYTISSIDTYDLALTA